MQKQCSMKELKGQEVAEEWEQSPCYDPGAFLSVSQRLTLSLPASSEQLGTIVVPQKIGQWKSVSSSSHGHDRELVVKPEFQSRSSSWARRESNFQRNGFYTINMCDANIEYQTRYADHFLLKLNEGDEVVHMMPQSCTLNPELLPTPGRKQDERQCSTGTC